ncbi:MAG: hypothetical protein JNK73_02800 [Bacteroidia bacterium]|nr:hypothetical protein [Bacteroidia bacterium]
MSKSNIIHHNMNIPAQYHINVWIIESRPFLINILECSLINYNTYTRSFIEITPYKRNTIIV